MSGCKRSWRPAPKRGSCRCHLPRWHRLLRRPCVCRCGRTRTA